MKNISENTIFEHLLQYYKDPFMDYKKFMTQEEYDLIDASFEKHGNYSLKIIKDDVDDSISYEQIKLVRINKFNVNHNFTQEA